MFGNLLPIRKLPINRTWVGEFLCDLRTNVDDFVEMPNISHKIVHIHRGRCMGISYRSRSSLVYSNFHVVDDFPISDWVTDLTNLNFSPKNWLFSFLISDKDPTWLPINPANPKNLHHGSHSFHSQLEKVSINRLPIIRTTLTVK